ncbi:MULTISPECIES: MCE family protein [Rhodococcus]|uniref:MCE family protein n=1 Tax=Rhodococcus TaxID=1827 RepID=UPI000717F0B3|nr:MULTISPECIES: MlaD family protein [Rhodococcus]MCZ4618698.1 MlaD family protein [Rhodococcus qingshengii]MEA1798468.1 MlaD family protein [Rhodococcus qingshengii]ORI28807.1 mammalian cell entry protein [Rhodococcus erythropolis]
MHTKLVKGQLIVFAILAIASLVYGLIRYVGIQRLTGFDTYTVSAEFTDGSGIYKNALVTYRGLDIGRVTAIDLDLASDVVRVSMQLRNEPQVPADTLATIKSMSAIGEQFVDLTPATERSPYLADGDVIRVQKTSVPTSTAVVLDQTQRLLDSVAPETLRTAVDETYLAFDGTGPALSSLIDSSSRLLALAQTDIGPTLDLVHDAEPLLNTGNEVSGDVRSFTHDLASFTEQLTLSDGHIRGVLDHASSAADTVSGTLAELDPTLPVLLSDLQTGGQVLRVNLPQLRQILVVYPALSAVSNYSVTGFQLDDDKLSPQAPLDIKLGNTLNPPPCTEGYQSTVRRDPSDIGPAEVPPGAYCKVAPDNPKVPRGARNLPCATDPSVRTADIANCPRGLPSTWPEMLAHPGDSVPGGGAAPQPAVLAPARTPEPTPRSTQVDTATPYSEAKGAFRGPDGITYILGQSVQDTAHGKEDLGWQSLLIK